MEIRGVKPEDREVWNRFVREHYPPVGAFMQSWGWGEFQEALGRRAERYIVKSGKDIVALFALVHHALPLRLSYGYLPRGPVIAKGIDSMALFNAIRKWARGAFPSLVFLRLEPPMDSFESHALPAGFCIPPYYVQPRYNLAVPLEGTEDDIAAQFHSSTRSNIRRAENRGVTVTLKTSLDESEYEDFFRMIKDTSDRTKGKNVYPSDAYLRSLLGTVSPVGEPHDQNRLSLGIFCGYQHGKPASTHIVLFFGETATYLYGASYRTALNSKVTTYLHFAAMREAKRRGMRFYDLGGIDSKKWPTLTDFKRQFRGVEFSYIGNIDMVFRPALHRAYTLLWRLRRG